MAQLSDHTKAVFRGLRTAASETRLVTHGELAAAAAINLRSRSAPRRYPRKAPRQVVGAAVAGGDCRRE